jgi:GNAT superfamily N-acetyltransferase
MSTMLPDYHLCTFRPGDPIPGEAEELFATQLADFRQQPLRDIPGQWTFALTCAVTAEGHILGGVHLDIGPIGGAGPLADAKLAYLERTLVRPEHRRQGLATAILRHAIQTATDLGCLYIRCSNNWDNPAERALFLRCGFALVDLDGETDPEPCYMAVRSLQNLP